MESSNFGLNHHFQLVLKHHVGPLWNQYGTSHNNLLKHYWMRKDTPCFLKENLAKLLVLHNVMLKKRRCKHHLLSKFCILILPGKDKEVESS